MTGSLVCSPRSVLSVLASWVAGWEGDCVRSPGALSLRNKRGRSHVRGAADIAGEIGS